MIELFKGKENCCGCSACMNVCIKKAIIMKADQEGFSYPIIQENLCIKCGLCEEVCAFNNAIDQNVNNFKQLVYAAKHISDDVRYASTSGGMFTAISDKILAMNGAIYGTAFDKEMNVRIQRVVDKKNRDFLKGSKYVQSDMAKCFENIELDINKGLNVLFIGTPCQVAAVRRYLCKRKINKDNLLLCDFICHGVPSPLMFSKYLELCQNKKGEKIVDHIFRSKINGWHNHTEVNIFEDGESDCKSYESQLYKNMFHSHLLLRPSCHNCKYSNLNRPSDITVADFWGIEKSIPKFDDNGGISLLLLNTKKGEDFFSTIKENVVYLASNIENCLQPNLKEPTKPSPLRNKFWEDYQSRGFEFILKKYFGYGLNGKFKRLMVVLLKKTNLYNFVKNCIEKYRYVVHVNN